MIKHKHDKYKDILKKKLCESNHPEWPERYIHSLGVLETALTLNKNLNLGLDEDKIYLAAILHDYAKYEKIERFKEIINKYNLSNDLLNNSRKLYHSIFGPWLVKDELEIDDEEILSAIRYHTTGRSNMTTLEEVIFLSDFIEPSRDGEIYSLTRKVAKNDLKAAVAMELDNLVKHLNSISQEINGDTKDAYEYYKKYLEKN